MAEINSTAGSASMAVAPQAGGRLSSLIVEGRQLLVVDRTEGAMQWGSYPMVPWAGRIRDGRFSFHDRQYNMPLTMPPHAIHGVGHLNSWTVVDDRTISIELPEPWPFGGLVTQRFDLDPDGLTTTISVTADRDMPVMVGWHPWFNRTLTVDDGTTSEADIRFGPASMYQLDEAEIPTGALVPQPEGPWDNCFTDLPSNPVIEWPGLLTVELSSSCDHWVVFNQRPRGICVEPQSDAPDAFNRTPDVLSAGQVLEAWYRISWG